VSLDAGHTYMFVLRVATRTAGTVKMQFTGGTTVTHTVGYNVAGEYMEIFTAATGNTTIGIQADSAFAGTINVVQVRKVTSFYDMGVKADYAERLLTNPIDMSGSNEMTVIVSGLFSPRFDNMNFAQVAQTAIGTGEILQKGALTGARGFDAVPTSADVTEADPDFSQDSRSAFTYAVRRDTNQALVDDQHQIRFAGLDLAYSNANGPFASPTANPSGARISLLSWLNSNSRFCGTLYRVILINRRLTDEELASATAWCMNNKPAAAVLGDSTWQRDAPTEGAGRGFTSSADKILASVHPMLTLSNWGDDTTEQNTKWSALTSPAVSQLRAVIIGTGLNDIAGRVDGGATVPQILSDLQSLIDEVRADCPNAVIVGSQLYDVDAWLDGRTNAANCIAAHAAWNTALTDGTITGLDAVATDHLALINDGTGDLPDLIGTGASGVNDGVHPGEYGRLCMAVGLREALVSIGLAEAARTF
jgi:hypothetical protein